ncbi:hypothetical protein N7505_007701 [Penicillium chrysogenum]|nr:hypothetical protein N7505_007701 [Penicillium chrysogenum]
MARGSTMASKTTRPRMRKSKTTRDVGFQQIVSTTMDATQSLALQYHFDPANSPSGDPCLIRAIVSVRVALDTSRTEETSAEQEWKQQWKPQQRDGAVRHALGVVGINRRPLRTFELRA